MRGKKRKEKGSGEVMREGGRERGEGIGKERGNERREKRKEKLTASRRNVWKAMER